MGRNYLGATYGKFFTKLKEAILKTYLNFVVEITNIIKVTNHLFMSICKFSRS